VSDRGPTLADIALPGTPAVTGYQRYVVRNVIGADNASSAIDRLAEVGIAAWNRKLSHHVGKR